ncbi:MAG: DUF1841 family protein [Burkholderiales bacterium]
MPFFHDQDRSSLRRSYVEAWRKWRERLPMEPLEHQIGSVVEQHPEYHPVLEQDAQALHRDYSPEGGQSNPFLHMGMHLAIREQVVTNRPAGITAIHAALSQQLGSAHEAEHRMIECLGEALWNAQRSGLPPDESAYLESLRRLAGIK